LHHPCILQFFGIFIDNSLGSVEYYLVTGLSPLIFSDPQMWVV